MQRLRIAALVRPFAVIFRVAVEATLDEILRD